MTKGQVEHYIYQAAKGDPLSCNAKINLAGFLKHTCGIINLENLDGALQIAEWSENYSFEYLIEQLGLTLKDITFEFTNVYLNV